MPAFRRIRVLGYKNSLLTREQAVWRIELCIQGKTVGVMIFPAYMQGGWLHPTSTEVGILASLSNDIGKSYTPRFFNPLDTSYYTLLSESELEDDTKYISEEAHDRHNECADLTTKEEDNGEHDNNAVAFNRSHTCADKIRCQRVDNS